MAAVERRVQGDEPLRRGKEDDRIMAAPAMRVGVLECLAVPEMSPLFQRLFDDRVCVEHTLTVEQFDGVEEMTAGIDRRIDLEAILEPGDEVIAAVSGGGVHRASAGLERDVVGKHAHGV